MSHLSRRLSPASLFMISLNGIIGSGWLFSPLYVAKIAGPASIISWLIGGFVSVLIALTFAELSTMFPITGGSARIPQLSHGAFASFILGWIGWLTSVMLVPIEVQAILQYAYLFFPSLMINVGGTPHLTLWGFTIATFIMLFLCLINIVSYSSLMRFNSLLFYIKVSVIVFTIFALLHTQFHSQNFSGLGHSITTLQGWQTIFSAVASGGIVLAFNGFKNGVDMAGETKNLSIAIPLSTVGAVIACLFLYLGLQLGFMGALSPATLTQGWENLTIIGENGPLVALAALLSLFLLHKLLCVTAILSPMGAGLIYVTTSARILYAMSRMGYVPKFLSTLNNQKLPVWAIVVNFVLGMLSFLPLPGWQAMVNFIVSLIVITYALGPVALICFRLSLPQQERPFYLPFANSICILSFYCCNLFTYWTGWETISKLSLTLLVGVILFFIAYFKGNLKIEKKEVLAGRWVIYYLIGMIVISYLGAFGGKNIIPFGWDFAVIAMFTLLILKSAIENHREFAAGKYDKVISAKDLLFEYN